MPEGLPPELAARYAQLRERFVAGLETRLAEIDAAPDATALHAALHRLAGAAGSYGCDTLGALARGMLDELARQPGSAPAGLPALRDEARRLAGG